VPTTEDIQTDSTLKATVAPVRKAHHAWLNWRTAGIVAALCVCSAFMLEMIATELVSQEMITVIVVSAIFFLLLGFCAARSRALAERPKWFIFTVWVCSSGQRKFFLYQ